MGQSGPTWNRIPIAKIEDLSDAVYGAGLEATQMSSGSVSGSIIFSYSDDILFNSGYINGQITLEGPLSQDQVTLGVGLELGSGSRHWLKELAPGATGIFLPGDEHDAFYTPGALYLTATMTAEKLEAAAANEDLVLDLQALGESRIDNRAFDPIVVKRLARLVHRAHSGQLPDHAISPDIGWLFLRQAIHHYARLPRYRTGTNNPAGLARVIKLARAYIREHLDEPISIDALARASMTSRRTLFRAFSEILDDTPQAYVRRLRLHRIRQDLATDAERITTVTVIANRWGINELGRLSGYYRDLFGEYPSDTLTLRQDSLAQGGTR